VDAVFEGVPRMIGRAPVYVLYTREAVLHGYPDLRTLDARVYFADELAASPELRRQRGARPARYFHFDLETLRLTEPAAADRETLPGK
jgi:hypothetical protein